MLTPAGYGVGPFSSMVNSLRRITPAEAAAIRPKIIHAQLPQRLREVPASHHPGGNRHLDARPDVVGVHHAVVPGIFTQTAGKTVTRMHDHMMQRKAGASNPDNWPDYEI